MSQKDIGVQMIILGRAYSHTRLNIENYIYITNTQVGAWEQYVSRRGIPLKI